MRRHFLTASLAALLSPCALADFAIDGIPAVSTERGQMGRFAPSEERGMAAFRHSDGELKPRQDRYKNAEMLIDLSYSPVIERGNGAASLVDGFADDVPFVSAMAMIIPQGWHIYKHANLGKSIPERISFVGGKTWPNVLKDIGDRYALQFHIDWYDRTLMIEKGRPSMSMRAANIPVIAEPKATPAGANKTWAAASSARPAGVAGAGSTGALSSGSGSAPSAAKTGALASAASSTAIGTSGSTPATVIVSGASSSTTIVRKPAPAPVAWSVSTNDGTIREALTRWAKKAGWTFEAEHWSAKVDIPLTASATFGGDFKEAVQQLVGTTELTDTPLQPCFYSNRVVRVVPYNEACDRMSR